MTSGLVFNIQRYTIHDGPGIRTELFLKGCSLHCEWCSNPEGLSPLEEVGVYPSRCVGADNCSWCHDACPVAGALRVVDGKIASVDRQCCIRCMKCTDECPADALKRWGTWMSVDEAMDAVLPDIDLYRRSGGGVTVSGGESLLQADFVRELFSVCREKGIHTCVESALNIPWSSVEKVLPVTDLFISDVKHMDSAVHKARTGVGNELILENLRKLAGTGISMILRIPVIEGFNADEESILASGRFIASLGKSVVQLQLLPYRRIGTEKYASLELPYTIPEETSVDREIWEPRLERYAALLQGLGINAVSGSNTKIKQ